MVILKHAGIETAVKLEPQRHAVFVFVHRTNCMRQTQKIQWMREKEKERERDKSLVQN